MAPFAIFFRPLLPGEREPGLRSPRPRAPARPMPNPSTSCACPVPTTTFCPVGALTPLYAHLHCRRLPTPNSLFNIPVCLLRTPHQPPCSGDRDYVLPRIFVIDDFLGLKRSPRSGRRSAMAPHSRPSSTQGSYSSRKLWCARPAGSPRVPRTYQSLPARTTCRAYSLLLP